MIGQYIKSMAMVLVVVAAMLVLTGCEPEPVAEISPRLPNEFLQDQWTPQETPVAHVVRRDYRMREGDYLEIIYHIRYLEDKTYEIKLQDVIEIRFPFNSELDQTEQVQSDGNIYLDLIGPVKAVNMTIDEVRELLNIKYAKFVKSPVISVSFKESNVKIRELKEAIVTSPRGQSRLVPITPDGMIQLPFIVETRAAGLTVGELHRKLNKAYAEIGLEELEVTVNVETFEPLRIYVLGEVKRPGQVLNQAAGLIEVERTHEVSLLQAIAMAGSYIPGRAELSKVMVVRRRDLPRPQVAIINVFQLLENRSKAAGEPCVADMAKHRFDIWLDDGDIIYIPTTEIAKRADYIEYVWTRGIRAVGGFSSNASFVVSDGVNWLGGGN